MDVKEQVIEGTWEEIAREAGDISRRFPSKRMTLIVPADGQSPPKGPLYLRATPQELSRALDELAERNRHLTVFPPEAFERESLYDDLF